MIGLMLSSCYTITSSVSPDILKKKEISNNLGTGLYDNIYIRENQIPEKDLIFNFRNLKIDFLPSFFFMQRFGINSKIEFSYKANFILVIPGAYPDDTWPGIYSTYLTILKYKLESKKNIKTIFWGTSLERCFIAINDVSFLFGYSTGTTKGFATTQLEIGRSFGLIHGWLFSGMFNIGHYRPKTRAGIKFIPELGIGYTLYIDNHSFITYKYGMPTIHLGLGYQRVKNR